MKEAWQQKPLQEPVRGQRISQLSRIVLMQAWSCLKGQRAKTKVKASVFNLEKQGDVFLATAVEPADLVLPHKSKAECPCDGGALPLMPSWQGRTPALQYMLLLM